MTPNQKYQLEQHQKDLAVFDTLLDGFEPLAELQGTNDLVVISRALERVAIGITTVLQTLKAEKIEDYERRKNWP